MDVTRRKSLLATGAALGLSGCIDDITSSIPTEEDGDNENPDDLSHDVFQLSPLPAEPLWATVEEVTGFITLVEDENDRQWMVQNLEEREDLQSWLNENDLEQSSIIYAETAAPNTCYTEIGVNDIGIENGEIVGTLEAVDISDESEGCGAAETHPSALICFIGEDLPSDATFTVIDGWGESSEVTADGQYADPEGLPGHVRPEGHPSKLEELSCDDENFQRLERPAGEAPQLGQVYDDDHLTFAMRIHAMQTAKGSSEESSPRVGHGDDVRVNLWNVSTSIQHTGNRHKWHLQVLTMDGWQDVRGTADGNRLGYDDLAIEHRPGEGFQWIFQMTEDGVLKGHVHEDKLEVCPDLQPGRYRFVYHGIVSGEPIAVEFNYHR